jgi:hypothetical protein
MLRKEVPEGAREWVIDGRRVMRVMEGRRVLVIEGLRRGERGGGDPGWTCEAQEVMLEKVFERRRKGGGEGVTGSAIGRGREGRGRVGRFFWGGGCGGFERKGNGEALL